MEIVHVLGGLLSLATTGMLIIAGMMAVRHVGGAGPVMMLIGSIGSMFTNLFWAANSLGGMFGYSLFDRVDPMRIGQIFGAISSFSTLCRMITGIGVFLMVLRMVAMVKRGAVMREIGVGLRG